MRGGSAVEPTVPSAVAAATASSLGSDRTSTSRLTAPAAARQARARDVAPPAGESGSQDRLRPLGREPGSQRADRTRGDVVGDRCVFRQQEQQLVALARGDRMVAVLPSDGEDVLQTDSGLGIGAGVRGQTCGDVDRTGGVAGHLEHALHHREQPVLEHDAGSTPAVGDLQLCLAAQRGNQPARLRTQHGADAGTGGAGDQKIRIEVFVAELEVARSFGGRDAGEVPADRQPVEAARIGPLDENSRRAW
jgi:hypothetical protein